MSLKIPAHPGEGRDPDGVAQMWVLRGLSSSNPPPSYEIWVPAFAGMSGVGFEPKP
jgi:hypothetical protein